ncbi:MAG: sporulation protein YunB [Clostridia bacterium]|nr:sporulation protein YunB [Clostridia bacterium]
MRGKKSFVFFLILIVIVVFLFNFYINAVDVIQSFCESKARYIALDATNKSIIENIDGIEYEDLVKVERDENNKVVSLSANTIKLTKLSTEISSDIKERISNLDSTEVNVPITSILKLKALSSVGPKLHLKLLPSSSVIAVFKSEFEEAGINQVRNRIYIEVTTKVRFLAPIQIETQEYVNQINVVETILVGDVPATYYSISGMENLSLNDSVEFLE